MLPLLELDLLRTLVAIAETGNFSAAGDAIGRTPSAVSMQVKRVEELLGRRVFLRDSRSVRPTQDGEFLLEHARRALALNREIVTRFIDPTVVGAVRLGAPDDVAERFLPDMLRRFAEAYPGVSIRVVIEGTARMAEMVSEGRLDLAIVTYEAGFACDRDAEALYREPLVWAGLKDGLACERRPLPISVWEETCLWRSKSLARMEELAIPYSIVFESANIVGQRAAVLADLAVATLPRSALSGKIVEVDRSLGLPPLPDYALGLLVGSERSAPLDAASDHLRSCFSGY